MAYCSRACQKAHWKAGHKQSCLLADEQARASSLPSSASGSASAMRSGQDVPGNCASSIPVVAADGPETKIIANADSPTPVMEHRCLECGMAVMKASMKKHKKHECSKRQVECSLGCGMRMTYGALASHVEEECENRLLVGSKRAVG